MNRTTEESERGGNGPVEAETEESWRDKERNGAYDDLTQNADRDKQG